MNLEIMQYVYFGVVVVSLLLLSRQKYYLWIATTIVAAVISTKVGFDYRTVGTLSMGYGLVVYMLFALVFTYTKYIELNKYEHLKYILLGGIVMFAFCSLPMLFNSIVVENAYTSTLLIEVFVYLLLPLGYMFLAFRCVLGAPILAIHFIVCGVIWYVKPSMVKLNQLYTPTTCIIMGLVCLYVYHELNEKFKKEK